MKIIAAAIKLPSGNIVSLPKPSRHHDIINNLERPCAFEQGFLTDAGTFVTREEAYIIARNEGQILFRCDGDEGRLFSDNLWKKPREV